MTGKTREAGMHIFLLRKEGKDAFIEKGRKTSIKAVISISRHDSENKNISRVTFTFLVYLHDFFSVSKT